MNPSENWDVCIFYLNTKFELDRCNNGNLLSDRKKTEVNIDPYFRVCVCVFAYVSCFFDQYLRKYQRVLMKHRRHMLEVNQIAWIKIWWCNPDFTHDILWREIVGASVLTPSLPRLSNIYVQPFATHTHTYTCMHTIIYTHGIYHSVGYLKLK